MASPTPNKGYTYPAHGGAVGAWDTPLNTNFDQIDLNVGGVYGIALSTTAGVTYGTTNAVFSSTVATLTLPAANAQNLTYVFSGTITQNTNLVFPGAVGGLYNIWNNSTSAFTLTALTSVAGSSGVVIPSGTKMLVCSDKTNMKQGDDSYTSVIGTSGTKLTYASGNNAFSGNNTHSGTETFTGAVTISSALSAVTLIGSVIATSATQSTGTSSNTVVSPLYQMYHLSAAKKLAKFDGATAALSVSQGVSSVSNSSTGFYTVSWSTNFSTANYIPNIVVLDASPRFYMITAQSTDSISIRVTNISGTNVNPNQVYVSCFGTLA